ncbi:MAG: MBL fold metallo-hydrolase [Alphaproteobacteria bacterium HGW-Alphaproteobacteria-4]|nr:MAG: MBL fold metallo-hydrolase [Alphaproteobacteria bacterium HGW-Alphaproteobacteria-4]
MKIIVLGTGGPRPDPRRMASTVLIRLGAENILFDAGRGVMVQMARAGVPLGSLRHVFLTHHHFDHIGDLYDVMLNSWLAGRREALEIRGPQETERLVRVLQTEVYDKDIAWRDQGEPTFGGWAPVLAQDIGAGSVLDTGHWRVSAEVVSHGDGLDLSAQLRARWTCLGYRFEAEGKVVAISGDTVPCPGLARLADGADILVQCCFLATPEIEGEHFRRLARHTLACGDSVGRIAAAAGVKTLVLTHHRPRSDDAMLAALERDVRADFHGRLIIAEDLTAIEL